MLRQQTKLPESSQAYGWLWQSSYSLHCPIELTSEHQGKFLSFHTEPVCVMITGSPSLGLPEKLKNTTHHSITGLKAMQTPSGFIFSNSPQLELMVSSLLYLCLPLWRRELYDEVIEQVNRLKQLRWNKGQGLCMEGCYPLFENKQNAMFTVTCEIGTFQRLRCGGHKKTILSW